MTDELKTYLVSLHGRGASYAFLVKGEVQDVANRCKPCTNSGFEVYIYELVPSPHGVPGFAPTGSTPLKQVYHLYDAHDLWIDEARAIVDKLTMHSEVASLEYLGSMIKIFDTEMTDIIRRQQNGSVSTSTELLRTGSETTERPQSTGMEAPGIPTEVTSGEVSPIPDSKPNS